MDPIFYKEKRSVSFFNVNIQLIIEIDFGISIKAIYSLFQNYVSSEFVYFKYWYKRKTRDIALIEVR